MFLASTFLLATGWLQMLQGQRLEKSTCEMRPSHTSAVAREGDNGYAIHVLGEGCPHLYDPGEEYDIVVNGTYKDQKMLDYMIVAVPEGSKDNFDGLGSWQRLSPGYSKVDENCPAVVTAYEYQGLVLPGAQVRWKAPPRGSGCVEFRAMVLHMKDIWYRDDGHLTYKVCESESRDSPCPSAGDEKERKSACSGCCACGTAKYRVKFQGLWSAASHPKTYPSGRAASLLHWSDFLGASHSCDYTMWDYGQEASSGVQKMCEFGFPFQLNSEVKDKRKHKDVFRANGLWGPQAITKDVRTSEFTVDRAHPLFSFLTMIGPSPDWCVGVTKLNLCSGCSWINGTTVDLYPWDAGTDSGISYMSPNAPTWPREKIHRLTNTHPDNPHSPFHGPQSVRPMATITLTRLTPVSEAQCPPGADDPTVTGGDRAAPAGVGDAGPSKCSVSEWSKYSDCSATCGLGAITRRRTYLHPMGSKVACPHLPLTDSATCLAPLNACPEGGERDVCDTTPWSDWSPCTVECNTDVSQRVIGETIRTRRYFHPMGEGKCSAALMEKETCSSDSERCRPISSRGGSRRGGKGDKSGGRGKDVMTKPEVKPSETDVCLLPAKTGMCRAYFPRWYYDSEKGECAMFVYGGCGTNGNMFETMEDCAARCDKAKLMPLNPVCKMPMDDGMTKCDLKEMHYWFNMVTGECETFVYRGCGGNENRFKTHWECSLLCSPPSPGAMEGKEMMKRKAMPADCQLPSFSGPCFASIRRWFFDMRMMKCTRFVYGGCGGNSNRYLSKAQCEKSCPQVTVEEVVPEAVGCMVSEWQAWGDCSVACGLGKKKRARMVKRQPAAGGEACPSLIDLQPCDNKCQTVAQEIDLLSPSKHSPSSAKDAAAVFGLPEERGQMPKDCNITSWSPWTACVDKHFKCRSMFSASAPDSQSLFLPPPPHAVILTAVLGEQARFRAVLLPGDEGGVPCPTNLHETKECLVDCSSVPEEDDKSSSTGADVDCVVSPYGEWSACSKKCGKGKKVRRRTVVTQAQGKGKLCPKLKQGTKCMIAKCGPKDCKMTKWTKWGKCMADCESKGKKTRTRTIKRPALPGGQECGPTVQEIPCMNSTPCLS